MSGKIFGLILSLTLFVIPSNTAPISIHAFDIFPTEYLEVFNIIYDQELSKQFLELYHRFGAIPDRFYADARYEFPQLEKRVRGIIVNVQQRARHLTPAARNFLELLSKHVDIVLIGSPQKVKEHVTNIINEWSKLSSADKESFKEQFADSAIILESERYQKLLLKNNTN